MSDIEYRVCPSICAASPQTSCLSPYSGVRCHNTLQQVRPSRENIVSVPKFAREHSAAFKISVGQKSRHRKLPMYPDKKPGFLLRSERRIISDGLG